MTETPAPAPLSEAEERNQAKLTHILNGIFPLWGGLILWQINKDKSAFLDRTGKEATNWGIWVMIAYIVGLGLCVVPGIAVWAYAIYLGFQGGAAAAKGEDYAYPTWLPKLIK